MGLELNFFRILSGETPEIGVSCFAYSYPSLSTEYFSRSSCTISLSHEGQRQLVPNGLEVYRFIVLYLDSAICLSGLSHI